MVALNQDSDLSLSLELLEERQMLSSVQIFATGSMGDEAFALEVAGESVLEVGDIQGGGVFSVHLDEEVSASDVRIAFTNDLWDPANGIDRNLKIDKIVIDGNEFQTESPSTISTGTWDGSEIAEGNPQSEWLHVGGYFQFSEGQSTGPYEFGHGENLFEIRARGDEGTENMKVLVNGRQIASIDVSTTWQIYKVRTNEYRSGDELRIEFTNDQWDPAQGIDSNLNIDYVIANGEICETEAPTTFGFGTWNDGFREGFNESETLHSTGYFLYKFDGGQNDERSLIQVRARGDEGTENMRVLVDGEQIASINVTKEWQVYDIYTNAYQAGGDIRIEYTNDEWDPAQGIDSNLYIDYVIAEGVKRQSESPTTFGVGTWVDGEFPAGFNQSEVLNSSGYFIFKFGDNPIDLIPKASPDSFTTDFETNLSGNVILNDEQGNGPAFVSLKDGPNYGTVQLQGNGQFVYRPNSGFSGTDSFQYSITDLDGDTDTATVMVLVQDAPVVDRAPDANPDSFDTEFETDITGNVLANDDQGDGPAVVSLMDGPDNGTVQLRENGQFTYRPNDDFSGTDSFLYTITDADGDTDTGIVSVVVQEAPIVDRDVDASNDSFTTEFETTLVGNVLDNDDPGNGPSVVTLQRGAANGTVQILENGQFVYSPDDGFSGNDTFRYLLTDADGDSDVAIVKITVGANPNPDTAPICVEEQEIVVPDAYNRGRGVSVVIDLSRSVVDADGDDLTFELDFADEYFVEGRRAGIFGWEVTDFDDNTGLLEMQVFTEDEEAWHYDGAEVSSLFVQAEEDKDGANGQRRGTAFQPFRFTVRDEDGNAVQCKFGLQVFDTHYSSPIAFDLNGDNQIGVTGEHTSQSSIRTELGKTVQFDIDADGKLDTIEWFAGDGDGILVNTAAIAADGNIDGSALFGDQDGRFRNGYEQLELLDHNADGQISGREASELALWIDDGNAILEFGELASLESFQIVSIDTHMELDDEGRMRSSAQMNNGSEIMTEDVWFARGESGPA